MHFYALSGLLLCLVCYLGFQRSAKYHVPACTAYIVLCVGLLLRILYSVRVFGYTGDIISFSDWGARAVEYGFSGFYTKGVLTDYPPRICLHSVCDRTHPGAFPHCAIFRHGSVPFETSCCLL